MISLQKKIGVWIRIGNILKIISINGCQIPCHASPRSISNQKKIFPMELNIVFILLLDLRAHTPIDTVAIIGRSRLVKIVQDNWLRTDLITLSNLFCCKICWFNHSVSSGRFTSSCVVSCEAGKSKTSTRGKAQGINRKPMWQRKPSTDRRPQQ